MRYVLFERDPANLKALESELQAFEPLPQNLIVDRYAGDFEGVIEDALAKLTASRTPMAPSFIFVDPYGFKLPYPLLARFMGFEAVELLINVMWRHLDMAIAQARSVCGKARLLDFVFGCDDWRRIAEIDDHERRCEEVLSLIRQIIGARWATSIHMLGSNDVTEYVLLHLTNHDAGRDLMKRVLWRVCPSFVGRFAARKADDPAQQVLLLPDPDLSALETLILDSLRQHPLRWRTLQTMIRGEIWLDTHVNQIVNEFLKERFIAASDYQGRLSAKSNPVLSLTDGSVSGVDERAEHEAHRD